MNKYIKYIVVVTLGILFLSSCSVTTKQNIRTTSFTPDRVEMRQTLDDYEFLGEVNISVEYSRYLSIFSVIHTINGQPLSRSKNIVVLHGSNDLPISFDRFLNKAMYKAYKEYPNADFLVPTLIAKEKTQMFLGSKIKKDAKIKAYSLKK